MTPIDEAQAITLLRSVEGFEVDTLLPKLPADRTWWRTRWGAIDSDSLRHVFAECWA